MRRNGMAGLAALALIACGDSPDVNVDTDGDARFAGAEATLAEGDVFAMLTENGAVKLGLTADRVYLVLSDSVRATVDREMEEGIEESDNAIARSIGSAVRRGVSRALRTQMDWRVEDIRDVDYRDGELVFDFVDASDRRALESMKVDDEPVTEAFSEEDARAFVEAFRSLEAGATPMNPTSDSGGSF